MRPYIAAAAMDLTLASVFSVDMIADSEKNYSNS